MMSERHLFLQSVDLPPAAEWQIEPDCWWFMRVDQGVAYYFFQKQTRDLSPGDVLSVPPRAPGTLRASRISAVTLHYFLFKSAQLNGMLSLSEQRSLELLANRCNPEISHFPPAHEISRQFSALHEVGELGNPLLERGLMLIIIATLLGPTLKSSRPHDLSTLSRPARFRELIQSVPEIELINESASELARRCGCSLRRFGSLFRSNFGMPLRSKRIQLRLQNALHLLSESDANVTSISRDSGYRSRAAFTAMFKKLFGVTPAQLKRLNLAASKAEGNSTGLQKPKP